MNLKVSRAQAIKYVKSATDDDRMLAWIVSKLNNGGHFEIVTDPKDADGDHMIEGFGKCPK